MIQNGELDRDYWNIVKGLGILCIVLGHCCQPVESFVYTFHVPLFFFVSGFLYNEKKYGDDPYENLKRRLQSNWVKYIIIYAIYISLHNVFYSLMLLNQGAKTYGVRDGIVEMGKALFFGGEEFLISPLWFVAVLVEASTLLGFIVAISRRLFKKNLCKLIFQFLLIVLLGTMGYVLIEKGVLLFAYVQIAFAVMPYIWIGYVIRNYVGDVSKYIKWYVAIIALIAIILYSRSHLISLKDGMIRPEMYIMALLGIYVCLCLSRYLKKIRFLDKLFITMGVSTYVIMAFHFTIIRLIDRLYDGMNNNVERMWEEYLGHNLILLPIYLMIGIGLPILIKKLVDCLKKLWRTREPKIISKN